MLKKVSIHLLSIAAALVVGCFAAAKAQAQAIPYYVDSAGGKQPSIGPATIQPPAVIDTSASGATKIITGAANQSIVVVHLTILGGGTNGVSFVYGTGTNCATGQGNLTGVMDFVAQAGLSPGDGAGAIIRVPQGADLCVKQTGAQHIAGWASYVRGLF